MKEYLLKLCPNRIHRLYGDVKFWIRFHFFRKGLITEEFKGLLGYDMDWDNPKDINQKINWMKINYDTSEWSKLADKLAVRDYVIERIGEDHLPKIYGVWKNPEEIDFEKLPHSFVLKSNHGAGTVLPVLDKSKIDYKETITIVRKWLNKKYGYTTIEPHYFDIKPYVYAEELLINDTSFSKSLVDYKIYCFDGKAFCVLVCTDREIGQHSHFSYFDTDWTPRPDVLAEKLHGTHINYPKPKCLDELISCAEKLAEGHPQVRVDFYIVNNIPILGEMTFTSNGGYDSDITIDYSQEMGSLIPIP